MQNLDTQPRELQQTTTKLLPTKGSRIPRPVLKDVTRGSLKEKTNGDRQKPLKIPRLDVVPINLDQTHPANRLDSLPIPIPDIDADDSENIHLNAEYVKHTYEYLNQLESRNKVDANYFDAQTEIKPKMRCILVDWLVQVHHRFKLYQETLYLTVGIIDRFLMRKQVKKNKLQLVGVSAMLLAAKYEEIYTPEVKDFVYITDSAYTGHEIREMEKDMFFTLDYCLGAPLCIHFLRRYSKAGEVTPDMHLMAKFLMELAQAQMISVTFPPSQLAAGALCLTTNVLPRDGKKEPTGWNRVLEHYSGYSEDNLVSVMKGYAQILSVMAKSTQQAVYLKYSSSKFLDIAKDPRLTQSPFILQLLAADSSK